MPGAADRLPAQLAEALGDTSEAPLALEVLASRGPTDSLLPWPELDGEDADRLTLLEAYQALTRATAASLHGRAMAGKKPLLSSTFADLTVAALMREAYLDVVTAVALLGKGLDVQATVIIRHLWELDLRALVVAADSEAAEEFERAILGTLEGEASAKRLERLRERAWSRALSPAELMRRAARIEAAVDMRSDGVGAEQLDARVKQMRAVYFGFLSDIAHGGAQMVIKSAMGSNEERAPEDPLAAVGEPTDWCSDLLAHMLWLQARLWRTLIPAAVSLAHPGLYPEEIGVALAAFALDTTVRRHYDELLWSGIEWIDDVDFEES